MTLVQDGRTRGYLKILSIYLLLSSGYPSSWSQNVVDSSRFCPGDIDPSCVAEVVMEVGGCRSVFSTNVCNCQDDDPPVPCSLNPCTQDEPTTTTLYTTIPSTTEEPTTPIAVEDPTTTTATTTTPTTTTTPETTTQGDPGTNVNNCHDIYLKGFTLTTTYYIYPSGDGEGIEVYCIMDTDKDQGWTVIQRRVEGDTTDFNVDMDHYIDGFGNIDGSHWLGLDAIYNVIGDSSFKLKVEMSDWDDNSAIATYGTFKMTGPFEFKLTAKNYNPDGTDTAGNSMAQQNGMKFTTKDLDMDMNVNDNCAHNFKGGFWYNLCSVGSLMASPNGPMQSCGTCSTGSGIHWTSFKPDIYSLKSFEMMILPSV